MIDLVGLRKILDPIDPLPVECDGFALLAVHHLTEAGIFPAVWVGQCQLFGEKIPLHVWLTVEGWTIDYRLRLWLGPRAPHGVFDAKATNVVYKGLQGPLTIPDAPTVAALSVPLPAPVPWYSSDPEGSDRKPEHLDPNVP